MATPLSSRTPLGCRHIRDPGETIVEPLVANADRSHLPRQPLAPVDAEANRVRRPGLRPHVHEAEPRVHEVIYQRDFRAFDLDYYWSVYQSEWASDVMFRDAADLERLYPRLIRQGITSFA